MRTVRRLTISGRTRACVCCSRSGRSGWAIAAGYLGLLSFVILPGVPNRLDHFHYCRAGTSKRNPKRHGMGRAIFGLVMGIGGTVILAFGIISSHWRF